MKWCIGDIHGCVHTLRSLLDKVYAIDDNPSFVFVGDYIDRGKYSKQVIDVIIDLQKKYSTHCVCGNHDDTLRYLIGLQPYSELKEFIVGEPTVEKVFNWMAYFGMRNTIESYCIDAYNSSAFDMCELLKEKMTDDHKEFFANLKIMHVEDDFFVCHGYWFVDRDAPKDEWIKNSLKTEIMWSRFRKNPIGGIILPQSMTWNKIGVFGHTPTTYYQSPVPIYSGKVRLIDTCVFERTGYLTAYNVTNDSHVVQATDSRDLENILDILNE